MDINSKLKNTSHFYKPEKISWIVGFDLYGRAKILSFRAEWLTSGKVFLRIFLP